MSISYNDCKATILNNNVDDTTSCCNDDYSNNEQEVTFDMITNQHRYTSQNEKYDIDNDIMLEEGLSRNDDTQAMYTSDDDDTNVNDNKVSSSCKTSLKFVDIIRYTKSICLFIFFLSLTTATIFTGQTKGAMMYDFSPVGIYICFWILMIWLAQLEGGLNAMVALKPVNHECYRISHPITYHITTLCHRGDNLQRFIVGRQYLDLSTIFITSLFVGIMKNTTPSLWGLPDMFILIILSSGLASSYCTTIIGQLVAQINSTKTMLDFVNNYLMLFSTYFAFIVEFSGISHAVYLIQMIVAYCAGQTIPSNEPSRTLFQKIFFWLRVVMSTCLLLFATSSVTVAILNGNTNMYQGVPPWVNLLLCIFVIFFAGFMESLQISVMHFANRPISDLQHLSIAYRNAVLVYDHKEESNNEHDRIENRNNDDECSTNSIINNDVNNGIPNSGRTNKTLESFLMGRQMIQTMCMFFFAKIVTIQMQDKTEPNLWNVNDTIQDIFNYGPLGILLAVMLTSLTWRIIASNFPKFFLNCRIARPIIYLCVYTERSGIGYVSWIFASIHRTIGRFKTDEYYVQTYYSDNHDNENLDHDDDKNVLKMKRNSFDQQPSSRSSTMDGSSQTSLK